MSAGATTLVIYYFLYGSQTESQSVNKGFSCCSFEVAVFLESKQFRPRHCGFPKMTPGLLFVHEPVKFGICWYLPHHHVTQGCMLLLLCWLMQLRSPPDCGDQSCSDVAFKMTGQRSGGKSVDLTQGADEQVMLTQLAPDLTKTPKP